MHVLLEHSNRGKKSIGVDLTTDKGVELVYQLAATSDVFLTNKLPAVRKKLHMEIEDIRAQNPDIIYVAGTGGGERGPDADRGGYDFLSYWCRGASAMGCTPPDAESLTMQPAPGYGDSIGGMTIAGGIMGALFHRERTGEATSVDVSLLGVGLWAMSPAVALSLQTGYPWRPPAASSGGGGGPSNPLVGTYRTEDGRFLALTCLQGFHYWPGACRAVGREDLITDERFTTHELLSANAGAAREILTEVFASAPLARWRERLADFDGQWSFAQDTLEAVSDPQVEANGYVGATETGRRHPVPARHHAGAVRRHPLAAQAGARFQRALRGHPGRSRPRRRDHAPAQDRRSGGLSTATTPGGPAMKEQRRSRRIAMTPGERDTFLRRQRTCRVATGGAGGPHLTALWFVWDGEALWLNSIVKSQRWTDLSRDPRVSVLVDTGETFGELRGSNSGVGWIRWVRSPAPASRTGS